MRGNRIAIALATVALVLALVAVLRPYILRDRIEHPGISYIQLRDSNTGEFVGFIQAEYGNVTIARFDRARGDRIELKLRGDGMVVELRKNERVVATWSLSEDGEKLVKTKRDTEP